MSEFSRIIGVFFEPTKTFADIAERPRWFVPTLLVIIAMIGFSVTLGQHIGWATLLRHQMEANPQITNLPADQRENAIAMSIKMGSAFAYVGAVIGIPIWYLIMSGLLMGIASGIMSAGVKFKQVFAVVAYSGLPGIIYALLAIVVVFLKKPEEYNLLNPLAFNPAAFMDPTTSSKFVYSIASSIELFQIWGLLLMAVGIKAAAGKKLSFGGALFAVFLPWVVLTLIKALLAGMRG